MLAQIYVIVAIRDVEERYWPSARAIDQPAVGGDESDAVGLREIPKSVREKPVDLLRAHLAIEIFRFLDAG